ncbi:GntR family transcriptional regulator [Salipaludibacillus neizhouensis]|uniref:GntR family transcriptional regulator n=1 Tax=Salipaludibacillus neizhouensis TaxID=885475 RepID=A0A3A9KKA8_9BACI|nr:GntR family transcriptional regulator [Salipaludibacillus neizhouensis]RKL68235.1 GntR family transcriptional regulator [Salipaludibacillus neizhouensis]
MGTKYSNVKDKIKSAILEGYFQPHQKIGSESDLMKQHQVSRHTVRKAIDDLVNEGWLYKKQGVGSFCADRSLNKESAIGIGKNIAVITTYFSDYIFPTIIRGAEAFLSENGYQVTIFSTNNNIDQERRCIEAVISQSFDGLIVEPTKSALPNPNINYYLNLERMRIPYVMINAYYEELEPIHVIMDDVGGGYLQTEHLIKLGHENIIGFFKNDDIQGSKRLKGFIKAHRSAGLPVSPQNIITYTTESKDSHPVEELRKKLQNTQRPTAIVCYNDQLALSLLDVIREMNIQIPEQISIVGFDDSPLSMASEVKLTTIKHPKVNMGIDAAKTILKLIEQNNESSGKFDVVSTQYKPELVVRNSTGEKYIF